jgi:putative MATE family efflux protein
MIIAAIGASLNIGLDFALVYGIEDYITPMNIEGAAWASLISQIVMALLSLILLLKKTEVSLRLRFPLHSEISRLVNMSANLFVRALALNAALIFATREAAALGTEYIAAHTIAFNLWIFTAFFLDGYGAAGNILGGKLIGEKNYRSLWKLTKKVNLYNLGVAAILITAGFLLYRPMGLLFNKDQQVLDVFYSVFFVVMITLPFNSIAFTMDAIFKGLGEMKYLRNVLLGATIFGFIPVLFISKYMGWGLKGIWVALVVWVAYRAMALIIKFHRKYIPLIENK